MPRTLQILGLCATLNVPVSSNAGPFYVETGVGVGTLMSGALYWGNALPDNMGFNFAGSFGLFFSMMEPHSNFQVHIGAKSTMINQTFATTHGMYLTVQPTLRLEFGRIYIGSGLTPLAFKSVSGTAFGFSTLQAVPGAMGYVAEFGILWRPVDYFHFAIEGSGTFMQITGGMSPMPAITILLQMRFIFPYSSGPGGEGAQKRLDGWRYPFGIRI